MRIVRRDIDKSGEGTLKLLPESAEDLWHAYHLVLPGDFVRASTFRKVQHETATGSSSSERVRLSLTLEVSSVAFDATSAAMRVTGRVIVANAAVKVGAFHTAELDVHRAFTLGKKHWDALAMERVALSTDAAADADAAAVVMHDGLAHVCLLSRSMTLVRARVETPIPRKGKNALYNRDTALTKFYAALLRALLQHVDWGAIKVVLLASPGFTKDSFWAYAMEEAARSSLRPLLENRAKVLLLHCSSGYKHALTELLADPAVTARLADTAAVAEARALDDFFAMLSSDPARAVYGPRAVMTAAELGAVDALLVTDELFRSAVVATRRRYVALVEEVKAVGGRVHIFSTLHPTGERLRDMTGLAAVLRYPLPDVDDEEEEEESEVESGAESGPEGGAGAGRWGRGGRGLAS